MILLEAEKPICVSISFYSNLSTPCVLLLETPDGSWRLPEDSRGSCFWKLPNTLRTSGCCWGCWRAAGGLLVGCLGTAGGWKLLEAFRSAPGASYKLRSFLTLLTILKSSWKHLQVPENFRWQLEVSRS